MAASHFARDSESVIYVTHAASYKIGQTVQVINHSKNGALLVILCKCANAKDNTYAM